MKPIEAINTRIKELQGEIERLTEAKRVLSGRTKPAADMSLAEVSERVIAVLPQGGEIGLTRREVATKIDVPYDTVLDAMRILERHKRIRRSDATAKQKRGQRFVILEQPKQVGVPKQAETPDRTAHDKAAIERVKEQMKPSARVKRAQKSAGRTSKARRKIAPRGQRIKQLEDYLTRHKYVTYPIMAKDLGTTTANIQQVLYAHKKKDWLEDTGRKWRAANGNAKVNVYRSTIYQAPTREIVVRPGEGVHEGRRLTP